MCIFLLVLSSEEKIHNEQNNQLNNSMNVTHYYININTEGDFLCKMLQVAFVWSNRKKWVLVSVTQVSGPI